MRTPRIAVLIPCYNEEVAIGDTVRGFQKALPDATIYVYDNNSKDKTIERARDAGAIVRDRDVCRARATSCAGCSRTSRPTFI